MLTLGAQTSLPSNMDVTGQVNPASRGPHTAAQPRDCPRGLYCHRVPPDKSKRDNW